MSPGILTVFGAGFLTFFTPCVLPLIPIYLAALTGGSVTGLSGREKGRLLVRAGLFSVGFIAVFTAMGFGASGIGAFLSDHKSLMQGIGAAIILIFALKFVGILKIPFLDRVVKADDSKWSGRFGGAGALMMGVIFAAGWSPCVGPVLGSILTYTATEASSPSEGAFYLSMYGAGFALPLLLTAAFAELGMRLIGKISPHLPKIEKGIGVVLLFISGMLVLEMLGTATLSTSAGTPVSRDEILKSILPDARQNRPVMVELYSEDCAVCKKMKPVIEAVTSQCDQDGVQVRAIDVSKKENRHLAGHFNVVGVPTFLFFDETGNESSRLVGEQTAETLKRSISVLRGEPCPGVGMLSPNQWIPAPQPRSPI